MQQENSMRQFEPDNYILWYDTIISYDKLTVPSSSSLFSEEDWRGLDRTVIVIAYHSKAMIQ